MSHKANYWLGELDASALTHAEFRVLFHLCDAHNSKTDPNVACYPSQARLIERSGLSHSGLNKCLSGIEEKGLIRRRRTKRTDGTQGPTYYILGCDFAENTIPSPLSGVGTESTECADRVHYPSPLSGQEPVIRTGNRTGKGNSVSSSKKKSKVKTSLEDLTVILKTAVSESSARDFVQHRIDLGKPLTELAAKRMASKLSKMRDAEQSIDRAIRRGWLDVYEDEGQVQKSSTQTGQEEIKTDSHGRQYVLDASILAEREHFKKMHEEGPEVGDREWLRITRRLWDEDRLRQDLNKDHFLNDFENYAAGRNYWKAKLVQARGAAA